MILAIDIGNTNITLGVWKGDEMLFESRMETNRSRLRDQYALELKGIFDLHSIQPKDIEGSIISSVVPQLISTFSSAIKLLTGKAPMVVGPGIKTGLNIKIDNPAQLGADLAVGAIAAIAEFPAPSIIFDMGTATTVSVVGKDGSYLGGMIMPGIAISLDALISRTAQLPQVSIQAPPRVIGKNTVNCIQSGAIYGAAAMMDGVIDRIEEELGEKATVITTGGLANVVTQFCRREVHHRDNLLLVGLKILYEKNKS